MAISPLRSLLAGAFALALAACSNASAPAPSPSQVPTHRARPDASATGLLLDQRGVAMPLAKAVREIAFRPFFPPVRYTAVAVIPPLGNDDLAANRGIAFEYGPRGSRHPLGVAQQTFRITIAGHDATATPCKPVRYSQNGVVWTTPHGLVMTLQPDGTTTAAAIATRARALIAHGACR